MIPRLLVLLLVSAFLCAAQSELAELSYKVDAEWPMFPAGMMGWPRVRPASIRREEFPCGCRSLNRRRTKVQ